MTNQFSTVYIVRHGESQGNVNFSTRQFANSKLETHLTVAGKQQAYELSQKLSSIRIEVIFSSPLLRAKETAEVIAKKVGLKVVINKNLEEKRTGNLKWKLHMELERILDNIYEISDKITDDKVWKFKLSDEMESEEEVLARLKTTVQEIVSAYPNKTILVVTHGNIMRSLLVHLGYASFKALPYGSITNTGYIKIETDGTNFLVKETYGIKINGIS